MGISKIHTFSPITKFSTNILFYRRYIDGLFFIWKGTEKKAKEFTQFLNANNWGLSFTANFNAQEIKFLDLIVSKKIKNSLYPPFSKRWTQIVTLLSKVVITLSGRLTSPSDNTAGYEKTVPKMIIKQSKILKRFKRGIQEFDRNSLFKRPKGHKDCLNRKKVLLKLK